MTPEHVGLGARTPTPLSGPASVGAAGGSEAENTPPAGSLTATAPAKPSPPLDSAAILRHAEAEYAAAMREARKWRAVIRSLGGVAGGMTPDEDGRPAPGRARKREVLEQARRYLAAHGAAATARELGGWLAGRELPLPRDKLRQYLWSADGIGFDRAKGGWHLTADPPAARPDGGCPL